MDQTVMSFAGTAARGSAIPTPVTGMYTHLEDTPPRLEFYNGSSFQSPFGMTLVQTTTFTSSTLIRLNSVFSSKYDNYVIVGQISSASTTASIRARFLSAVDTPTSSSNYNGSGFAAWISGGLNSFNAVSEATFFGGITNGTLGGAFTLNVISPFLTTRTAIFGDSIAFNNHERFSRANTFTDTTSLNGIQFECGATLTGNIRVYGLRNS
jgi:hypothetical protein